MIKQLKITNFQKHKKLVIDFCGDVNSIIGATDCGKSAIIRAIQWVAFNRPSGDDFRTWGTHHTEVTIVTDKHTITRRKDKKFNGYILDGQEHAAVGVSVPEPVQEALAIAEINCQSQHDPIYLLSASTGEVGKQLNQLVDLSIIDSTMTGLLRRVRDKTKTISVLGDTLKQQQAVVDQFEDLPIASKQFAELVDSHKEYTGEMARSLRLQAVLREVYKQEDLAKNSKQITQALDTIGLIEDLASYIADKQTQVAQLSKLISRYESYKNVANVNVEEAISEANQLLTKKDKLLLDKRRAEGIISVISVYSSALDRLALVEGAPKALRALERAILLNKGILEATSRASKVETLLKKITACEKRIQTAIEEEKRVQEEHKDIFGPECPLCGHSMAG